MKLFFGIIICVVFFGQVYSQTKEVAFTLDDRDRIMRTEVEIGSFRNEMKTEISSLRNEMISKFEAIDHKFEAIDQKFDALDHKFDAIDSKIDILYWGFGIVITLILFLFGYIVFDRRTNIKPVEQDISIIKHRQNNLSKAIHELAQIDKKFAEAIKKVAL